MRKSLTWILVLFFLIVLLKVIISLFVVSPTIFGDEYTYVRMAHSFFFEQSLNVHGEPATTYPPLYPLLLSVAYFFDNMSSVYLAMKIINAILSTLILFPVYFLFRMFLDEYRSRWLSFVIGLMPFTFTTSSYLMSENLFAPLFLTTLYFVLKSFTEKRIRNVVFAGVFLELTLLTRVIGVVLFAALGAGFVYFLFKKDKRHAVFAAVIGIIGFLLFLPWVVWTTFANNSSPLDLASTTIVANGGSGNTLFDVASFLLWGCIHLLYLLLASGGLLAFFAVLRPKNVDQKAVLFFLLTIALIVVVVLMLSKRAINLEVKETTLIEGFHGRIIGRYLDYLLPLIVLGGYLGFRSRNVITRSSLTLLVMIIIFGSLLFYFPLLPYNNLSLSFFGAAKIALEYLFSNKVSVDYVQPLVLMIVVIFLIACLVGLSFVVRSRRMTDSSLFLFLLAFFSISSILSVSATVYNAQLWHDDEQLTLGRHINTLRHDFSRLVVDERFCGQRIRRAAYDSLCAGSELTFVGFWTTHDVVILSLNDTRSGDYIVTKATLPETFLKETEHGIRLYKKK